MKTEATPSAVSKCCGSLILSSGTLRQGDVVIKENYYYCMKCEQLCPDNPPQDTTREEKYSVRHCGYCSEGHDGACDGVLVESLPPEEGKPSSLVIPPSSGVQSQEEMEKLLEKSCEDITDKMDGSIRDAKVQVTHGNKTITVGIAVALSMLKGALEKVTSLQSQLQASQVRVGELQKEADDERAACEIATQKWNAIEKENTTHESPSATCRHSNMIAADGMEGSKYALKAFWGRSRCPDCGKDCSSLFLLRNIRCINN